MSSTNSDIDSSKDNSNMDNNSISDESPVYLENLEHIHDIAELERLTSQNVNVIFDAECVRKRSNWSKSSVEYKFDTPAFNPQKLLESIPTHSPKLNALLSKIESLDKSDMKKHGKLFKHFIFSDIKSSSFGAKLIAGALIAKGFKLGYNAPLKNAGPAVQEPAVQEPAVQEPANVSGGAPTKPKQYGKIELLSDEDLAKTPGNNFYLLASIGVYDQPISVKQKKAILQKMNQRPENVNGELARIIVMDSGFKEGIDLFDIKYIHIFEPQVTSADQKQVIGRGTRTCGQKGLEFHPTRGWPLHVFIYDVDMPEPIRKYMANSSTAFDLYLKALNIDVRLIEFTHDLERATIFGSVDYELNKNIHNFSIARGEEDESSTSKTIVSSLPQVVPESSLVEPSTNYSSLRSTVSSLGSESPIAPETNAMSSAESEPVTPENTQETPSSVIVEPENTMKTPTSVIVEPENTQETPPNVNPLESENTSFLSRAASIGNSVLSTIRSSLTTTPENKENTTKSNESQSTLGGGPKLIVRRDLPILNLPSQYDELTFDNKRMTHSQLRKHIRENFGEYSWDDVKMENLCKGGASHGIKYTPTQDFIRHYFTPENPVKGMLLFQSVGTGKTCSAIAAATTSFVPKGYTILWVTRTTLKNDIWKNMFDQICNEQIKEEIKKGLTLPAEHAKRMRMLSKEWSIRPMSYKQFSNLVSKQNNFYKSVVKKNGEADPLRKTLLIIDEAHKLYGGGDLSSLERPDMNALKQSIQQSFQLSGADSVKLLLMTATPITENPMELIQLINLCKPAQEQMPEMFSDFSNIYLDEHGRFTPNGETRYLNDIAGYISYLNREKDARQFAQPIVRFVTAPIVENMETLNRFDKNYVRQHLDSNVVDLKERVKENLKNLEGDLSDLDMTKFNGLNVACDSYEGKEKKSCEKIVKQNIKLLLAEAKSQVKQIRDTIKGIREEIKNKNLYKNETLKGISENLENNPEEYAKFKDSLYYNLKSKCGKTVRSSEDLKEAIQIHPVIVDLNQQINEYDTRIAQMHEELKTNLLVYKKKILQIRELMKTDVSPIEKNVLRMVLRDERKKMNRMTRRAEKENTEKVAELNKTRKAIEKKKQKKTGQLRKTLKERLKEENQYERENKKAEKQVRKTLRKQGIIQNIENEMLQELFNKYSAIINEELKRLKDSMETDEREQQMKLQQKKDKKRLKEDEKNIKAAAKEQERLAKRAEKEREKAAKKAERERLRETKRAEKMVKKNKTIKKNS
uniref:Helicase ATP-binding domain-containing protein n=1 Tax=viral metagenome TaxID=1070528 RepID=A0A6C0ERC0_9ZZZZ